MDFLLVYLSIYVRNLAIFILFMTFVGIVSPSGKYKNYINLVMGFVFMFLMISPIVNLISSWDNVLINNELLTAPNIDISSSQTMQTTAVLNQARSFVEDHVYQITREYGFIPISVSVDAFMETPEDFVIRRILINIEDADFVDDDTGEIFSGIAPIVISEVIIGSIGFYAVENMLENIIEDSHIIDLKNYLSQFYNMSQSNIHVIINR